MSEKITKTEAEWRAQLSAEEYHVTREKGTEPAFSGAYAECHDAGMYNCIGCGNCERNCPYGVIQMGTAAPEKPGLLSWLLMGAGPGPGEDKVWNKEHSTGKGEKIAVKCDMCKDLKGGPACVRACPTGAAIRISPEDLTQYVRGH